MNPLTVSNASKAVLISALNANIAFVEAFGIYALNDEQKGALAGLVNTAFLVYVALTHERSHRRKQT